MLTKAAGVWNIAWILPMCKPGASAILAPFGRVRGAELLRWDRAICWDGITLDVLRRARRDSLTTSEVRHG